MKTSGTIRCVLLAAALSVAIPTTHAQMDDTELQAASIEGYLERLRLSTLLAEQLEGRLMTAAVDQRGVVADKLGRVYASLLGEAKTPDDVRYWEGKATDLLARIPDAESHELRIHLNRTLYQRSEEIAERHRLRIASAEEVTEAERSLRQIARSSRELGSKLHTRVQQLEKLESTLVDNEALSDELSETRRLRSQAYYYAGWAGTYLAMLTGESSLASEAMNDFGWLLNSRGKTPTVAVAQASLFVHEHVARAAMGCAMCASIRGNDVEAIRWLDLLTDVPDVSASVKDQLPARRLIVYAGAKRWADVERLARTCRRVQNEGHATSTQPLSPAMARLLAIVVLEADRANAGPLLESLAKSAVGDLVARKEVGQVLDLVKRYGTAPLGDTGFIVYYVRGLQQYEAAKSEHPGFDSDPPLPAPPNAANSYRDATSLLLSAVGQNDANEFGAERVRAFMTLGRAVLYSGDSAGAIEHFAQAWSLAGKDDLGEESLWLAVLAADRAVRESERSVRHVERRTQLITMYLQAFPESPRAPKLVLLQASEGELNDEEALKVLSAVETASPTYQAARRQIARILFNQFRSVPEHQREYAATKYLTVAEEVLTMDLAVSTNNGPEGKQAAERVVSRIRQMLEVMLQTPSANQQRADELLRTLRSNAVEHRIDISKHEPELLYRSIQALLLKGDLTGAVSRCDMFASLPESGTYASAAERLLFRRFASEWNAPQSPAGDARNLEHAQRLARIGVRVIDRLGAGADALGDPAVLNAYSTTADAAMSVFQLSGDQAMREVALRLDGIVLSVQPRLLASLRRTAIASESIDDLARARAAWTSIAESAESGSANWFEARFNLMRVLSRTDEKSYSALMTQHRALFPDFGPEPWGQKLRELYEQHPPQSAPAPGGTTPGGVQP